MQWEGVVLNASVLRVRSTTLAANRSLARAAAECSVCVGLHFIEVVEDTAASSGTDARKVCYNYAYCACNNAVTKSYQ